MKPFITITKGSCVTLDIEYTDVNGVIEDITPDSFEIAEVNPAILNNIVLTKTDPINGVLTLTLEGEFSNELPLGNASWFRISRIFPDGCRDNTERIGITVE